MYLYEFVGQSEPMWQRTGDREYHGYVGCFLDVQVLVLYVSPDSCLKSDLPLVGDGHAVWGNDSFHTSQAQLEGSDGGERGEAGLRAAGFELGDKAMNGMRTESSVHKPHGVEARAYSAHLIGSVPIYPSKSETTDFRWLDFEKITLGNEWHESIGSTRRKEEGGGALGLGT